MSEITPFQRINRSVLV